LRAGEQGDVRGVRRAALALGLALGLAGCGGDDERLSRAEFVDRATAICERAEERIGELGEPGSVEELAVHAREARTITEEGVADLRELEPPEPLEDGFERYLGSADDVVGLLGELERAAEAGDEAEAARIARRIGESAETQGAARAAGIEACEDPS
jgi:hypothetical protein